MAKINLGRIKLQFQGEFDKNQVYRRDDIVYHNNAMYIMTNEYLPDGTNAYAPGTKIFGYNPNIFEANFSEGVKLTRLSSKSK